MNKLSTIVPVFLEEGKKKILVHIAASKIHRDEFFNRAHSPLIVEVIKSPKSSHESLGELVMIVLLAKVVYEWPDALIIKKVNDGSLLDAVFCTAEQMGDVDEALNDAEWVEIWNPSAEE